MTILDTNVVSELMRKAPDPGVLGWLRSQNAGQVFVTVLSVAEIRRGLALLPEGDRRSKLEESFRVFLAKGFHRRILLFTEKTSLIYAGIYSARVRAGLPVGELEVLIAGIAKEHNARIATRNTKDFEGCGLRLVNPWLGGSDESA